jgi:hypothetical protein
LKSVDFNQHTVPTSTISNEYLGVFSKDVGRQIPHDTCMVWINNYSKSQYSFKDSWAFKRKDLGQLLEQKDCIGIMFYFGLNKAGAGLMLAYPVIGNGYIKASEVVLSSIGVISSNNAKLFRSNYEVTHPNAIKGEYFGSNAIRNLLATQGLREIIIRKGLNQVSERLLLSNSDSTASFTDYDDGYVCPKFCPLEY